MFLGEIPQEYADAHEANTTPATCLPHWVAHSGVSIAARVLFIVLATHHQDCPEMDVTREDLATFLGEKNARRIPQYEKELTDIGAIEVRENDDSIDYVIHYAPPVGYTGPLDVEQAMRRR